MEQQNLVNRFNSWKKTKNDIELKNLILDELPTHESTIFEYFFDASKECWISWKRLVPAYKHNPERKFYEILVPTIDTCRSDWLLQLSYRIKRPVLFVGESGTSKTATINSFLRKLNPDQNVCWIQGGKSGSWWIPRIPLDPIGSR